MTAFRELDSCHSSELQDLRSAGLGCRRSVRPAPASEQRTCSEGEPAELRELKESVGRS